MNNSHPPASEQASKPPERLHDTAGMMLRKGRESANLTHAAVSEALHLTVHYIKALENDNYSKLPGTTFVKGYLRTYARFLKLDVNAVLASYEKNNVSAEELNNRTESLSRSQRRNDQTFRWAVITAVIIVAGVAAGWWFVGKDQVRPVTVATSQPQPAEPQASRATTSAAGATVASQNPAVQAGTARTSYVPTFGEPTLSSQAPVAEGLVPTQTMPLAATQFQAAGLLPATGTASVTDTTVTNSTSSAMANSAQNDVALTVAPTAGGARQVTLISEGADIIQLYFKGASWVEIDDGARGRLYNETLNTGDAMTLHGTAPFQVLLGDASQVELTYNSVPVDLASQTRGDKTARFSLGMAEAPPAAAATSGVSP